MSPFLVHGAQHKIDEVGLLVLDGIRLCGTAIYKVCVCQLLFQLELLEVCFCFVENKLSLLQSLLGTVEVGLCMCQGVFFGFVLVVQSNTPLFWRFELGKFFRSNCYVLFEPCNLQLAIVCVCVIWW